MVTNSVPTLKRPRTTSTPPSPSSTSSPKRAASEDPFDGSNAYLTPTMQASTTVSSPLREVDLDSEDETQSNWVERTGEVSLRDGNASQGPNLYEKVLKCLVTDFVPNERYHLVPTLWIDQLRRAATGDQETQMAIGVLAPTGFAALAEGTSEEVFMIQTEVDGNARRLVRKSCKETIWTLNPGLVEDEDFMYMSEDGVEKLVEWFGLAESPTFPRYCLPGGRVELNPPTFTLHVFLPQLSGADAPPIQLSAPSTTPLPVFLLFLSSLAEEYLLPNSSVRYWQLEDSPGAMLKEPATRLTKLKARLIRTSPATMSKAIDDAQIVPGEILGIEISTDDPSNPWSVDVDDNDMAVAKIQHVSFPLPKAPPPLFAQPAKFSGDRNAEASSSSLTLGVETRSMTTKKRGKGLRAELTSAGVYQEELNPDNPLGMSGQVAEAFGEVIENLWSPSTSSYSPRKFKYTTSRFAPSFAGYGQHDTQEFIAFLLDGLHEDLNRIKKKPYVEKPDWKPGGGDKELAELGKECWDGYKKRNDSVIVDLFQGQLRSTLVCPECHKESITMDPFMYLTVPLPIAQTRLFKLRYVPLNPEKPPVNVKMLVPQNASFAQIKEKLASLVKYNDIPVFHELSGPVVSSRKVVGTPPAADGSIIVPVYTFKTVPASTRSYTSTTPTQGHLEPFFITLKKEEVADPHAVREAITRGYVRWVKADMRESLWVPRGSDDANVPVSEPEESVIEIHVDGADTRVVEVSSDDHLAPINIKRNPSSASLISLVPRGDLFKIHVSDASSSEGSSSMNFLKSKDKDNVIPFFKAAISSASSSWSQLETRKKPKKHFINRITSGISSIVGNTSEEDLTTLNAPPSPVVRPGEGIYCEWSPEEYGKYLGWSEAHSEITEVVDENIEKELQKKKEGKSIRIEDCLDEFSREETLGQDDLWYCPQCKKHQAASKKLEIYKAPDILVICIKRFGSSRRLSDKLDQMVHFPIDGLDLEDRIGERKIAKELNLSAEEAKAYGVETSDEPMLYDLYAVDNHFGGMGGGHYTAFCRNKVDGEWYNYDDSRVSKASVDAVESRAAYLLFYRRRTERPIGGISKIKIEEASRAPSRAPSPATTLAGTPFSSSPPSTQPRSISPSSTGSQSRSIESEHPPGYDDNDDLDSPPSSTMPSTTLSSASNGVFAPVAHSIGFGNTAWSGPTLPSPPDSVVGDVVKHTETSGLGEEYQVVSTSSEEDAEMVSAPRSPEGDHL
ncbi:hypothetical protein P7C73_g6288, partial [Tremellales sp. Uapishka_1]